METNWASEHLQVIRTLMERSALYRRALAPIMMVNGIVGVLGAGLAYALQLESNRSFSLFWIGVSLLAIIASLLLVRRQALKEEESFWSPPTRRVTQALLPTFVAGLAGGGLYILAPAAVPPVILLAIYWLLVYGFALHAAGFFMQRGIKLLGWGFILGGCVLLYAAFLVPELQTSLVAHALMGAFFGLLQLAYSVYLYFTENRREAA